MMLHSPSPWFLPSLSPCQRQRSAGTAVRTLATGLLAIAVVLLPATVRAEDGGFAGLQIQGADQPFRHALGLESGRGGVLVRDVASGGPAEKAGLQRGDLISTVDGVAVSSLAQVVTYMQGTRPSQVVPVEVWHQGGSRLVRIPLASWPDGWSVDHASVAVVPRLGATFVALTEEVRQAAALPWGLRGIALHSLEAGSVAGKAGLQAGDVVIMAGRQEITDPARLDARLAAMGKDWFVVVNRNNRLLVLGPGVRSEPVSRGDLLAVQVADGPMVVAVNTPAPPLRPGDRLPSLPAATPEPAEQTVEIADDGLVVASLTPARRRQYNVRWNSQGALVLSVREGSRGQQAGLTPGLVIESVNQVSLSSPQDLQKTLEEKRKSSTGGSTAMLLVSASQGYYLLAMPLTSPSGSLSSPLFSFGEKSGEK